MGSCVWGKSFQIVKIAWFLGVCSGSSDDLGTPFTCSNFSKSGIMLAPHSRLSFFSSSFSFSMEPSQISIASRIELWTHNLWSLSHLFGNELSLGNMMSPTLFGRRGWLFSWGVGTLLYPEWPYLYLCLCLGLANSFLYTHTHTQLIFISGILLYLAQFPSRIASSNFSLRKTSLISESELQYPPWYSHSPSTTYTRS